MIQSGLIKTGAASLQYKKLLSPLSGLLLNNSPPAICVQARSYAARKGYRKEREAKKVKKEVVKLTFAEKIKRQKESLSRSRHVDLKFDDSWKPLPVDNVWIQRYYRWKVYSFKEAVESHRETHHPEMYNQPQARLNVRIELNMEGEKQNRFLDDFHRVAYVPHKFEHGEERTILAFVKNPEIQELAKEAGATLVVGPELIKQVQNGSIMLSDFQTIIAHPDILNDLVPLRGLMKKRFPNPRNGTLDGDLPYLIHKYLHGIKYSAVKNDFEKDFGLIETFIGTLDTDINHLEENFASLIRDVYVMKPKREGEFIRRVLLWSPPSREKFKVDYEQYIETKKTESNEEDDDEDEVVAQSVTSQ